MDNHVRVMIEPGKKGKKVVAVAFDWPGWERCGKSEENALEVLETYRPRYREVAELAGLGPEFERAGLTTVVEYAEPNSNPDFHGISGSSAVAEREPLSDDALERKIAILRACWQYFDETHPNVSENLRKGPRGGGRDRHQVMIHTYLAEEDFARKVNVRSDLDSLRTPEGRDVHREAFVDAIRRVNAGEPQPRTSWTLQFTLRRACYHMLDHAWEMEDRNLAT